MTPMGTLLTVLGRQLQQQQPPPQPPPQPQPSQHQQQEAWLQQAAALLGGPPGGQQQQQQQQQQQLAGLEAALALIASGGTAQAVPPQLPQPVAAIPPSSHGLLSALLGLPSSQCPSPKRQPSVPQAAALSPRAAGTAATYPAGNRPTVALKTDDELLCLLEALAGRPQALPPPCPAAAGFGTAAHGLAGSDLAGLLAALAGPQRPGPL